MEMRSLEVDFDREVLKINGKEVKETPVIVTLPGPDGWNLKKVFNPELATGNKEECNKLEVCYSENFAKEVVVNQDAFVAGKEEKMTEEKMRTIFESMQGITYLEWTKLRHSIDRSFDVESSNQKDKMLIADPEDMISSYKKSF